ncbi:MAG: DUF5906 domain-containing protein [Verrucomicrobiota bacterium]
MGPRSVFLPINPDGNPVGQGFKNLGALDIAQIPLVAGSIGVMLGEAGLVSLHLSDEAELLAFVAVNPEFSATVIVRSDAGYWLFFRLRIDPEARAKSFPSFPDGVAEDGELMNSYKVKRGNRIAGHLYLRESIAPLHGDGFSFVAVRAGELVDVDIFEESFAPVCDLFFWDICWPEGITGAWERELWDVLTRVYGRPFTYSAPPPPKPGEVAIDLHSLKSLSQPFWAGWFARRHNVIWEANEDRYYAYDSATGGWRLMAEDQIKKMISDALLSLSRDRDFHRINCREGQQPEGWERIFPDELTRLESPDVRNMTFINGVFGFLKGEVAKRDIFKTGTGVIHLKNGMIDLRSCAGKRRLSQISLEPFSWRNYSRNPIPVPFDPSAKPKRFLRDLVRPGLEEKDDVHLLMQWMAQCLIGQNDAQKIMIVTGPGGRGKSTILKVLQYLIGRHNIAELRTEHLVERFEMGRYIGKTMLMGMDVEGNFLQVKGAKRLKQLTGDDLVDAELKGSNETIELEGTYNIGIVCNGKLKVSSADDEEAWDRRLLTINFDAPKPKKVINKFARFLVDTEGPGILNAILSEALKIMKIDDEGRVNIKISQTDKQESRVADLLSESNSIRVFLENSIEKHAGSSLPTEDITSAYARYCELKGWEAETTRKVQRQLGDMMLSLFQAAQSRSVKSSEGGDVSGYRGVRFIGQETERERKEREALT